MPRSDRRGSRLGGTKVFRFAMVPDSAGGLSLPPIDYPYFDPSSGSYRVAKAPGTIVPILEPAPIAARQHPVPLLEPGSMTVAARIGVLPGYVRWGLLLLPALGIAGVLLVRRLPRKTQVPEPSPARDRLQQLVRGVLPPGTGPSPAAIVAALRHAGIPSEDAERLAKLHLGLETLRFSGRKSNADPERRRLDQEIEGQLRIVPDPIRRMAGLARCCRRDAVSSPRQRAERDHALQPPAVQRRGRGVSDRGRQFPSAERWYNVAAAEYMAGRDAEAAAALIPVRSERPREPGVRALWNALAREHGELRRVGRNIAVDVGRGIRALDRCGLGGPGAVSASAPLAPRMGRGPRVAVIGVLIAGALGREAGRAPRCSGRRSQPAGFSPRARPADRIDPRVHGGAAWSGRTVPGGWSSRRTVKAGCPPTFWCESLNF